MADVLKLLERNAAKREVLLVERDDLIRRASVEGVPVTRIALAVGLSPMHVYRVLKQEKK